MSFVLLATVKMSVNNSNDEEDINFDMTDIVFLVHYGDHTIRLELPATEKVGKKNKPFAYHFNFQKVILILIFYSHC